MSKKNGNNGNKGNKKGGKNPDHARERKKTRKFHEPVLKRDNKTCYYCGELGLTVDHLLPISLGGLSSMENLVCCCDACNQEKDNMTESEYHTYCIKRNTDRKKQEKRRNLEVMNKYAKCIKCANETKKLQLENGKCQKCRHQKKKKKKNNKKGH